MKLMKEREWHANECMISLDEQGYEQLKKQLATTVYDCVVVGGGIRIPPKSLQLFEHAINIVHKNAPGTPIAFNTRPEDTAEAAARWIFVKA